MDLGNAHSPASAARMGPVIAACTLIGFGMGGFIDGILLHQILQWHQMISNIRPPDTLLDKNVNMFWDGIFHAFTWIMTVIGIGLLWRLLFRHDILKNNILLAGSLLLGWGVFNAMDSIANHYLLRLHNVREKVPNPQVWNHGFLVLALLQMAGGALLLRHGRARALRGLGGYGALLLPAAWLPVLPLLLVLGAAVPAAADVSISPTAPAETLSAAAKAPATGTAPGAVAKAPAPGAAPGAVAKAPAPGLAAKSPKPPGVLDHSEWSAFLGKYLRPAEEGDIARVRYGKVTPADRRKLQGYLERLRTVPVSSLSRSEQEAFWINLYNALTVEVILRHHPVKSIRDINPGRGAFKVGGKGPWDAKFVTVEGKELSLNDIEHRILRERFKDPRLHFALNCASFGCPDLAALPFTGARLDSMLEEGARTFMRSPRAVSFSADGKTLRLSSLFDWYRSDFGKSRGEVLAYAARYAPPALKERILGHTGKVDYHYDWSLNGAD